MSSTPFARFHSVDNRHGKINDFHHTGYPGYAAHLIRVQRSEDCIRFQSANGDGEKYWQTLRTLERSL